MTIMNKFWSVALELRNLFTAATVGTALLLPAGIVGAQDGAQSRSLALSGHDGNWIGYGNGLANLRYSSLNEIDSVNVRTLVPKWIYQTGITGTFQTSPVVVDGDVYLTTPENHLIALDGATGQQKWKYTHKMALDKLCCGVHNRGPAVGGGMVFEVTADGRLVALDRFSGAVAWDVPMLDPASGAADAVERVRNVESVSKEERDKWVRFPGNMAPIVYEGLVIVGTTGAGYTAYFGDETGNALESIGRPGPRPGQRAFISAFDAETGRLVWRWYSTKAQGWEGEFVTRTFFGDVLDRDLDTELANAHKYRDAWKRGGGSIQTTPAIDPELGMIYFGTGNAAPYADLYRPGDNLYTASIVALDVRTGSLRWYHQITPHDIWGYDVAAPPMLVDVDEGGTRVPAILVATKSGWVYVLERTAGHVLRRSEPFVPQGTMFRRPRDGHSVMAIPGEAGGANWAPGAYSVETQWAYVVGSHYPSVFSLETDALGNDVNVLSFPGNADSHGTISAVDPKSGRIVWQQRTVLPFSGGLAATAGGVLFSSEADGFLSARDVRSGEVLWQFQTGAGVNAPPVIYRANGKQFVAVASGGNRMFGLPLGNAVIAFGLPDHPDSPALHQDRPAPASRP